MANKKNDIIVLQIYNKAEENLPDLGLVHF